MEGGFLCEHCASGLKMVRFKDFAEYAVSKSFLLDVQSPILLTQARVLQGYFLKNLEDSR